MLRPKIHRMPTGNIEMQIIDSRGYDKFIFDENKSEDEDDSGSGSEEENKKRKIKDCKYCINLYGITKEGNSVYVHVNKFKPYFYIRIEEEWGNKKVDSLMRNLGELVKWKSKKSLVDHQIVYKKEFYGFTNNKKIKFLKLVFDTYGALCEYRELFRKKTIKFEGKKNKFELHESNIAPLLRFFHERNIQPAGWIKIPKGTYDYTNLSKCQINLSVDYNHIYNIDKFEIGPFLIASFDIECTSCDGSFPVAKRKEDKIIQIGTTVHKYGEKKCCFHHIITLKRPSDIKPEEVDAKKLKVEYCDNEKDVLIKWAEMIEKLDPDIITGYNIWGFDMAYMYERAKNGNCGETFDYGDDFLKLLSRNRERTAYYIEKPLVSAALGDNMLKYIDMQGRVGIDLLKVMMRDYKLESYKLDSVSNVFLKLNKIDLKANQIFANFKDGSPDKIKEIAVYCLKDCVLVNQLIIKLETIANNMGMANVCLVPFSYLFLRGQGIKIFSLTAKYCQGENFLIKEIKNDPNDKSSYEGAIVYTPKPGIYFDPIGVSDYSSLYPSSMIAENISHDTIIWTKIFDNDGKLIEIYNGGNNLVKSENDLKYLNLSEFNYNEIDYDNFEIYDEKKHANIDKKYIIPGKPNNKVKVGRTVCCYIEPKNGEKGVLPRILTKLLAARKNTRKKILYKTVKLKNGKEYSGLLNEKRNEIICEKEGKIELDPGDIIKCEDTYDDFMKAILNGLQLAYKIVANSLYGQCGSKTSSIYYKQLAACTTRTGRGMVEFAKEKVLERYPGTKLVYGDTDSIFINYMPYIENKHGKNLTELEKLEYTFKYGDEASNYVSSLTKKPQCLTWEKCLYPFIIFTKKRYVGNKYTNEKNPGIFPGMDKFEQISMGIVLKRRDNAPIVKEIYGGIIEIILNERNVESAKEYFKSKVTELLAGKTNINQLIISKSLRSNYANPNQIAHNVLAERIGDRDPGNKPMTNDRIPYCYIDSCNLECRVCGRGRLNIYNCKCINCMYLYCKYHIDNHKKECKIICRFCRKSGNSIALEKCKTCLGWYCERDMVKHRIRTDKYKVEHMDKCKKPLTRKILQGDIIENPQYIKDNNLVIDFKYYLDHQIMTPCLQIFSLIMKNPYSLIEASVRRFNNQKSGAQEITQWFNLLPKVEEKKVDKKMEDNYKAENDDDIFEEILDYSDMDIIDNSLE